MSLSFWFSDKIASTCSTRPPSSTALNFLAAVTTSELRIYTAATLQLTRLELRVAGFGGYSIVEVGEDFEGELVAVKSSRILSRPLDRGNMVEFNRHFNQITTEIRILSDKRLREHPNIVNILGICLDEFSGAPALSLVLQYSALGTLRSFLTSDGSDLDIATHFDLSCQVARGLEALHELEIYHGDVKIDNVLVFQEDDALVAKLSDFGQSVVANYNDPASQIDVSYGTPLLNAPEIRKGIIGVDFNIHRAKCTDVFSFGLLVWEIFKNGQGYFDESWLQGHADRNVAQGVELQESCLNAMAANALCQYGRAFIECVMAESSLRNRVQAVLESCLQDDPSCRKKMSSLIDLLSTDGIELRNKSEDSAFAKSTEESDPTTIEIPKLSSWTTEHSLYDIWSNGLAYSLSLDQLPFVIQNLVIDELKALATSPASLTELRSHAAMTVSECYASGFGAPHDDVEVCHWLEIAASEGLVKAQLWYHRVCQANGIEAKVRDFTSVGKHLEQSLASLPPEMYLAERIRQANALTLAQLSNAPGVQPSTKPFQISIFNSWNVDTLQPCHVAALMGDELALATLVQGSRRDAMSSRGFTPIHYACLGGNLAALKTLMKLGLNASTVSVDGISPLHMAIFFPLGDIQEAVRCLIDAGVSAEFESKSIKWDIHDIVLYGPPLSWAVYTRNKTLVMALLPYSTLEHCLACLAIAASHFYWEILTAILDHFQTNNISIPAGPTPLNTVYRPFNYWIAHGSDGARSIERTVRLCSEHALLGDDPDGSSALLISVNSARFKDDHHLIQAILSSSPTSTVKRPNESGSTPLMIAISSSKNREIWRPTICAILDHYTIDDLQQPISDITGAAYLHFAVISDSIVGAKALLDKGVDINQRSQDEAQTTPLHECMSTLASADLAALLIERGAAIDARHPLLGATPFQWLLMGRYSRELVESALSQLRTRESNDAIWTDTLHGVFHLNLGLGGHHRPDAREAFRFLLCRAPFSGLVDVADENGVTMLQKAAFNLHLDSLRLLLDTGADAGILLAPPVTDSAEQTIPALLPLQIACGVGRIIWMTGNDSETSRRKRPEALGVASELLRWHAARGDQKFRGITLLHLACCMRIQEDIERLLTEGHDLRARGYWPSLEAPVTPRELMTEDLEGEIVAIQASSNRLSRVFRHDGDQVFGNDVPHHSDGDTSTIKDSEAALQLNEISDIEMK